MKGKTTVKGTGKAPNTMAQANRATTQEKAGYAPAVPISVYRELAKELEKAKHQLSVVQSQNIGLKQQNQALRQEVIRIIQSAANLKDILQASKPAAVAPPTVSPAAASQFAASAPQVPSDSRTQNVAEELIAELDRTLAADIGTSFQSIPSQANPNNAPQGLVGGPFCEVTPAGLTEQAPDVAPEPLFTEQPTAPPNAIALEEEEKSGILGGIWLPLTLVVVIVTAFSAGFLIVLPFIEADKNN